MSGGRVVALDFGATSGRVVLGSVGRDELSMQTTGRFANRPVSVGGMLHWDVLSLWAGAVEGLRGVFRDASDIASIGVDSWGVDYGLLRAGRLLGNPVHYRDDRTTDGMRLIAERLSRDELFARNGLQEIPINTIYQLAAESQGSLLPVADRILMIADLVSYWLSGVEVADRTNASTTGLLDVRTGSWSLELAGAAEVPMALLPRLVHPGTVLGALRAEVAADIGAPEGVRVITVGSHDTASAVVAVPMDRRHAAYISCGTWGLVGVEVDEPALGPDAQEANFTNEGGVDGRIRLLKNVMGLWVLSESVRQWEREGAQIDLPALLKEAAALETDVPVFDVDDVRFLGPGDIPGRIVAWCGEHGMAAPRTRAEFARSIVESLAQAFADAAIGAGRLGGVDVRTIHIVGGGSLNELLCQRTADRSGLPVLAGPVEATALGNLLVQARAVGLIDGSLEDLRDLVARTHAPRLHTPR
jgi:rhamnulokinase